VYVLGCPATILPSTLPEGETGIPYSVTLTVGGGAAPATFAVTAGALPSGFTLTSAGLLSGVTAAAGDYSFTVEATDTDQCTTWHTYDLRIWARPAYLSGEGLGASNGNRVRIHDRAGAPTPVDFSAYGSRRRS
jgi:hypothetical protein